MMLWGFAGLLAGCGGAVGPELATVTGRITLDGQPLPKARVVFQPAGPNSSPSIAETRDDGTFELMYRRDVAGAMIGAHTARITTAALVTDDSGKETPIPEKLPPRFHKNSGLSFEVKPGENTFEIPLDSKPDPVKKLPRHRSVNSC